MQQMSVKFLYFDVTLNCL